MTVLALAPRLDLSHVAELAEILRGQTGGDLVLDAGAVSHLGGLGLQLLAAAAKTWRAQGHSLTIHPRSAAFDEALDTFGVGLADLQSEEAA
ncbi:MAG: STAS domain-containing protein [Paracoccaceae bacterium]|nr:STAS domain-containing protein [Paracoccaceae bacterium]